MTLRKESLSYLESNQDSEEVLCKLEFSLGIEVVQYEKCRVFGDRGFSADRFGGLLSE